jgi:hypothetical protein
MIFISKIIFFLKKFKFLDRFTKNRFTGPDRFLQFSTSFLIHASCSHTGRALTPLADRVCLFIQYGIHVLEQTEATTSKIELSNLPEQAIT